MKHVTGLLFFVLVALLVGAMLGACSSPNKELADSLNRRAYNFRYRNLDSTLVYARRARMVSAGKYDVGRAEAMNTIAFVDIAKMNYKHAFELLDSISKITDNQVELMIADVQMMRLCQRMSRNKEFYDYHEMALHRLHRINEEREMLCEHQRERMIYAMSEFYIVTSSYYYYVGLERQSRRTLEAIDPEGDLRSDTAQYVNYLYNVGAGGMFSGSTEEEVNQREFDYLVRCYFISRNHDYVFWEGNSLQAISEHLLNRKYRARLIEDNIPAMKYINSDEMPASLLAGNLAERSVEIFKKYGDVYQTAGSYRTLAACYWEIEEYQSALIYLQKALNDDKAITQAPDLVASIREQLSQVYAAMNFKPGSDYNRNVYLDLQEQTRQDRYYESRAGQLERSADQLNLMILAVALMILAVLSLLLLFHYLKRRDDKRKPLNTLLGPLELWQKQNDEYMSQLAARYDEIQEAYGMSIIHAEENRRRNLEQRTKVSLANNVMPLIDRMLNEVSRLTKNNESKTLRCERYDYISELTDKIIDYNNVLTQWIQLRQGTLSLRIESFRLQNLFDIVGKGRMAFQLKGIALEVVPTTDYVKADPVLTLFMINTLADNARKFTDRGGRVQISSESTDDYVEIAVTDTGLGIDAKELEHVFDRKMIVDNAETQSHGFGLMNCQGIINSYKKASKIFSVCMLGAESEKGRGSRFFFRLPKGIVRSIVILFAAFISIASFATGREHSLINKTNAFLAKADAYADSAYYSNINGQYRRTLAFADSSRVYLNRYYLQFHPGGKQLMKRLGSMSSLPAEIEWLHNGIPTDYNIILDIRNESAVAALALHEWELYKYNNTIYTHLFKENSADGKLGDYCRMMQKSETNKNIAISLLVILLLLIFPAYYFIYYRHRLFYQFCIERVKRINRILLSDATAETKQRSIQTIASDRFPKELRAIIKQIQEALQKSVNQRESSKLNIELADDELHKMEFENQRLHISNNILDNCLSTLKHETMYYPSRIKQLVDQRDKELQSLNELVTYYKEIYSILTEQVMRQVDSVKFVCKPVELKDILVDFVCSAESKPTVLGDPILLRYLFEILQKQNGEQRLQPTVERKSSGYMLFHVPMPALSLTDSQCLELFAPGSDRLPFLICRQIVRDNGEATNQRACGIVARNVGGQTIIDVTLASAN